MTQRQEVANVNPSRFSCPCQNMPVKMEKCSFLIFRRLFCKGTLDSTRLMCCYTVAATLWFSAETLKRLRITPAAPQVISQLLSAAFLIS